MTKSLDVLTFGPGKAPAGALYCVLLGALAALSACGGGDEVTAVPITPSQPPAADLEIRTLAKTTLGLTGDPATPRGVHRIVPADNALVKLGQLLFFSQTLAAGYDVSCGTCHHPDFAGSDGLSISVGVIPKNAATVGPGREIDPARDLDPSADGGPNMHRNSITTFNAALFDRSLMYDGRVFVLDTATASGGHGQAIRAPESGLTRDLSPLDGLMQVTMKSPIVNDNEMRSFFYTRFASKKEYREHLTRRLRGEVDSQYNSKANAAANWLQRFRTAFGQPAASAEQIVTSLNIQVALASYIQSQIFVDTPWRRFLGGEDNAISAVAREGARLFLTPKSSGGLGCNRCHAGDRFTDETFHNVAFPQIGRGFGRADHSDLGRWAPLRNDENLQAFRTPSLLNVARTAPYGHAGTFSSLEDVLAYHTNPREASTSFDFTLARLQQFRNTAIKYPDARRRTLEAVGNANFATAESLLPGRVLSSVEIGQLVAFLEALTDSCVATPACINQWAPPGADDPDGHMLVRNQSEAHPGPVDDGQLPDNHNIALAFPATPALATFADVQSCSNRVDAASNTGETVFAQRTDDAFGLADRHGYNKTTWFGGDQVNLEVAMIGGGITAAYLDADCWPDIVFTGGDVSGMRFYRNLAGVGFAAMDLLAGTPEREFSGAAVADLNGNYRRELLLGNIKPGAIPVYSPNTTGKYEKIAELPSVRPTFGISFAPLDDSGDLYSFLAHWSGGTGSDIDSPALWRFAGSVASAWDKAAATTPGFVDQRFNFTPKFADLTGDGRIDLLVASDFGTSSALTNVQDGEGGWYFRSDTDRAVITDQNGMGSTLLDIDNDGTLEWFVTSVFDTTTGDFGGNWGKSGNRMYRSTSTRAGVSFVDITAAAGVHNGAWGWGACAADFNNDGFIDLFHVNGFGRIPDDVVTTDSAASFQGSYRYYAKSFQDQPSRLFINNGNGTFKDQAAQWRIAAPSEGRGVICLDFDRDGDVDIGVFDHSRRMQFFENLTGSGAGRRFLDIRVVGAAPNTDAIGARVYVTAHVDGTHGVQTQLRLAEANSNFNSQNLPDLYFGVGEAGKIQQVRVVWPGGVELVCSNVAVNQFLVLDQRAGQGACPAPIP